MAIAKVIIDVSLDKEFDYLIPETLLPQIKVGVMVRVPFGHSTREGYVLSLADSSDYTGGRLKPRQYPRTPRDSRPVDGGLLLLQPGAVDPDFAARRGAQRQNQTQNPPPLPDRRCRRRRKFRRVQRHKTVGGAPGGLGKGAAGAWGAAGGQSEITGSGIQSVRPEYPDPQ